MSTVPHDATNAKSPTTVLHEMARDLDLDAAVRHFAATADGLGAPRPSSDELTMMIHHVAVLTKELFPGKLVIETGVDPESRDDVCFLFQIEAGGSVDEIVALNRQWHLGLLPIAPQWPGLFCLMIDAR